MTVRLAKPPKNLREQLDQDEDNILHAYPDPLTGGEPITIGRGHTGGIKLGDVWTPQQSDTAFDADIAVAVSEVQKALPWVTSLNEARQAVLYGMCFQMGIHRLLGFKKALAAAQMGLWATCRQELEDSNWMKQTPNRCKLRAEQMEVGEFL